MKIIILCGGKGTRLSEETKLIPKPMVKIGHKPILVHIIKIYMKYGFKDFILALGYKGKIIKEYFKSNPIKNANIDCVDTKQSTLTGGRILLLKKKIKKNEDFMVTYGDGVANINIKALINFHKKYKKIVTLTAVRPPVRFGAISIDKNNYVKNFKEKPQINNNWINGGFFVMNYSVFKFIKDTHEMFEHRPIEKLSKLKQVKAYKHHDFWQCMDTLREKEYLNNLWFKGKAKWK
tara:strand:- start:379 stop:1083 length:705 start_codon:yes stop_codon:yes gene_type:complete